uniref:C2H2-type domain-containing protein n=1 Tax=Caenorhabditis tropicalis TaxID=1561998 RepID=A0A1I7UC56_9PELO
MAGQSSIHNQEFVAERNQKGDSVRENQIPPELLGLNPNMIHRTTNTLVHLLAPPPPPPTSPSVNPGNRSQQKPSSSHHGYTYQIDPVRMTTRSFDPMSSQIRAVLSYQAQENMAARRDAAERQAQISQVLVDVTKMMLQEQENSRNFQKEIIEMFTTKLAEQTVMLNNMNLPSPPLPLAAPALPPAPASIQPAQTVDVKNVPLIRNNSYVPYSRRSPQRVYINRTMIGKGNNYDPVTGTFGIFSCRFCTQDFQTREDLVGHFESFHQKI